MIFQKTYSNHVVNPSLRQFLLFTAVEYFREPLYGERGARADPIPPRYLEARHRGLLSSLSKVAAFD